MREYLRLVDYVYSQGEIREDRTGTGTISLFGTRMEFDLREGFPLMTTKKVPFNLVASELLWFIEGGGDSRNLNTYLLKDIYPNTIWDEWADESGALGPIYGAQWRSWPDGKHSIDQLQTVINNIKSNPTSRRHIVSSWNVAELKDMALPPCHVLFQFNVAHGIWLDLQLYQRSADLFLGVPFNIASYALLLSMVAKVVNLQPRNFIWVGGDTHIYLNHEDQIREQASRACRPLPNLYIEEMLNYDIDNFELDDFKLIGYNPHPAIKAPISV
jgi:thymidylate synthase